MNSRSSSSGKMSYVYEQVRTSHGSKFKQPYRLGKALGKGGFATVYEANRINEKVKYAMKIIKKHPQTSSISENEKILNEVNFLKNLDHPGITKLIHYFSTDTAHCLLMQLCSNGSLAEALKKRKYFSESEVRCILAQMIQILIYIKSKKIIHRDMKLANYFLDQKLKVKLGDFGLATFNDEEKHKLFKCCGTPNYIAPEMIDRKVYGYEVDVWSTGVIIFTMLFGSPPFQTKTIKETYDRIVKCLFKFQGVVKSTFVSEEAKSLIRDIFQVDPKKRLKIEKFMSHPFMQNYKIPSNVQKTFTFTAPSINYVKKYSQSISKQNKASSQYQKTKRLFDQLQKKYQTIDIENSSYMITETVKKNSSVTSAATVKKSVVSEIIKQQMENQNQLDKSYSNLPSLLQGPKNVMKISTVSVKKEEEMNEYGNIKKRFKPNYQIINEVSAETKKNDKQKLKKDISIKQQIDHTLSIPINSLKAQIKKEEIIIQDPISPLKQKIQKHSSLIPSKVVPFERKINLKLNLISKEQRHKIVEEREPKIVEWTDYWYKFGMAFLLSNNSVGIVFKDQTKMLLTHQDRKIHYFYRRKNEAIHEQFDKNMSQFNADSHQQLQKKVMYLLQMEILYRSSMLIASKSQQFSKQMPVYVKNYAQSDELIIFKLSNGNLHCLFRDKISIFIVTEHNFIVYTTKEKQTIYSLPITGCQDTTQFKQKLIKICCLYRIFCKESQQDGEMTQNMLFMKFYSSNRCKSVEPMIDSKDKQ